MVRALVRLALALPDIVDEPVADGPPRHADGALDDDDILGPRLDVGRLELRRRVALVGGDEPGCHLHARCAHPHVLQYVGAGVDAASRHNRDIPADALLEWPHGLDHFGDDSLQRVARIVDLL
ncbi:MAG: hypothetical protein UY97_C0028G0001 [Parcubacteria group bacterium GW2011_GWB1_57_6]|nr:MAG: hypothetical protein UY97_C0028G0001 [Parcubacteria group bacterium GW2011_GWB1_57_6]